MKKSTKYIIGILLALVLVILGVLWICRDFGQMSESETESKDSGI
jgi:hypothetical protein